MKFIGFVGTNATRSTNRTLLQFMKKMFANEAEIELVEIKDLPLFNKPESKELPVQVTQLAEKIAVADGVIISTPEYDHSIPAVLKSMIEWLSYTTRPLIDKPVMITGASLGALGSSRAQAHLRQILDAPEVKARIMPSAEFLLGHSMQAFDEQGNLIDNEKVAELEDCFNEFVLFVEITNRLVSEYSTAKERAKKFSWEQA